MNYYAFHIGDYTAHTAHLDPLEDIAYRRLIDCYMLAEAPLPVDPMECARRVRMRDHAPIVEGVLREFFALTDDGWRHKRCDAEIGRAQEKSQKARESAAQSWDKRRNATAERTHSERIANAMRDGCDGNAPNTQYPIPIEEEKRESALSLAPVAAIAAPTVRGCRIPEGFPAQDALAWCQSERPDLDPQAVAAKFRDYWTGVPGAKGRKADWPATWRNFVRGERQGANARASPRTPSALDRQAEVMHRITGGLHGRPTIERRSTDVDIEQFASALAITSR